MTYLRSAIFQVVFYLSFIVQMIVFTPVYFLLPRKTAYQIPKNWARSNLWLARHILGLTFEIEGMEKLPKTGFILASKHQSFWDTFALIPSLEDPVYILKRELLWIPLFGWYAAKQDMIPINRADKGRAIPKMLKRAREELARGRELIIYPEGTRKAPGAPPDYKYGTITTSRSRSSRWSCIRACSGRATVSSGRAGISRCVSSIRSSPAWRPTSSSGI